MLSPPTGPTNPANPRTPSILDQRSTLIQPFTSITERLKLENFFANPQPLEIELGAGDGSFMVRYATQHPERNFLAVERLLGRLRKLDRKGRRAALVNVGLLRIEAAYFVEYLLPARCAQTLHIYFPDPWPKKKHRKHRLINARFPEIARQALAPGGVVYLRTDDADYFEQVQEVFAAAAGHFAAIETPAELSAVVTDFEREFNAQGIPTRRAAYQMK